MTDLIVEFCCWTVAAVVSVAAVVYLALIWDELTNPPEDDTAP